MKNHCLLLLLVLTTALGNISNAQVGPIPGPLMNPTPPLFSFNFNKTNGLHFKAPRSLVLTGLFVPGNGASPSDTVQNVAVVRFNTNVVPDFALGSTNAFTVLFIGQKRNADSVLLVNIPICQGENIGVFGSRSDASNVNIQRTFSGGANPTHPFVCGSNYNITYYRAGMDPCLKNTGMSNIYSDSTGNIGRINLFFDSNYCNNTPSVPIPVGPDTVCSGDTVTFSVATTLTTGQTIEWTYPQGTDFIGNPTATTTRFVIRDTSGTVCASLKVGNCIVDQKCANIFSYKNPSPAVVSNDTTICGSDTVSAFADSVSIGKINWSSTAFGVGISNSDSLSTTISNLQPGSTTRILFTVSNGVCAPQIDTFDVTYDFKANFSASDVCFGNLVNFTDSTLPISPPAPATWTRSWDIDNNGTTDYTSANPSHLYVSAGLKTIRFIATGSSCSDTVVKTITVDTLPTVLWNNTAACENFPMTFGNFSSINPGIINSTTWDFGDLSPLGSSTFANGINHTYTAGGTYTVIVTATTAVGCTNADTGTVTVDYTPVAAFTAQNACENTPAFFNDNSTVQGASNTVFYYDFGDGTPTGALANEVHSYDTSGTFSIVYAVESDKGCRDTARGTITIHPNPEANFTFDTKTCSGAAVPFKDSSIIRSGAIITWNYNFDDGTSIIAKDPTHQYANSGSYTVTQTVTSVFGCTDTRSKIVNISPFPTAKFTAFDEVCEGQNASFLDGSKIGSPGLIVGWTYIFGDGGTVNQQNPSYSYSAADTFMAKLVVRSFAGCTDTAERQIIVHPKPVVDFTADSRAGCSEFCATLVQDVTISPDYTVTYNWNLNNGQTSTEATANGCFVNNTNNFKRYNIELTATSNEGCVGTLRKDTFITVYPQPVAKYETSPEVGYALQTEYEFLNSSELAEAFRWNFGDENQSNLEFPNHIYQEPGRYEVTLFATNDDGCTDSITKLIIVETDFAVYIPTAFTPTRSINRDNQKFGPSGYNVNDFILEIYNRWGELIYTEQGPAPKWDGYKRGKACEPGAYSYRVEYKVLDGAKKEERGRFILIR